MVFSIGRDKHPTCVRSSSGLTPYAVVSIRIFGCSIGSNILQHAYSKPDLKPSTDFQPTDFVITPQSQILISPIVEEKGMNMKSQMCYWSRRRMLYVKLTLSEREGKEHETLRCNDGGEE
ncbi:hypothetical protein E3N88_17607 [Mikania micrantha]|uniref:Uncharacterized protein n=1 Tax=Mikania micrantha TaxID=192012 RepID=A0A5N6NSH9_9ASTR|nr:hypothetical protein E3N88_17607 [Mikania micrantha]